MAGTQTPADVVAAERLHAEVVAEHGVDSPEARESERVVFTTLHATVDIETGEEEIGL